MLDGRNNELVEYKDSNPEMSSQLCNVDYASDLSPDSDSLYYANANVLDQENDDCDDDEGKFTWQTYEYDEELEVGATTIFYNFEDDESM